MRFLFLTCLISLLSACNSWGQKTIQLEKNDYQIIGNQVQYFIDSIGDFSFTQIQNQKFIPSETEVINFSLTPFTLWVKFELESRSDQLVLLEIGEPNLEFLDLFIVSDGISKSLYQGGFREIFSHRPIKNRKWLFELDIEKDQVQTVYIRMKTGYPMKIPLSVASKNRYIEQANRSNLFWGIYFGILFFAFFYNFFLYLSLRERMYLYYCMYVLFATGFYGGIQGFVFRYIWPNFPDLNPYLPILICLMNLFVFLFTLRFLNIKKTQKLVFYGGWFFVSLYLLAGIINLLGRYDITVIMTQMLSVFMSIYYIYVVVMAIRQKIPNARYFAIAWVQFILLLVVYILTDNGALPANNFTVHSLFIGNALEVLLLSFALGSRINFLKEDNEKKQLRIISQLEENDRLQRSVNEELEQKVKERTAEVVEQKNEAVKQKNRSEKLLLNILPKETAEELKSTGKAEAKLYENVTVLFADMANFTEKSKLLKPQELVAEVNEIFTEFDHIINKYGIEKIKTIGDSYMVASGLPTPNKDHALIMIKAALDMQGYIQKRKTKFEALGKDSFEIRIGIHSGSAVAGVVGFKKFAFDIWGSTVNLASRMEKNGEINKINISRQTYDLVKNNFMCSYRGQIDAKGIGAIEMYFIESEKED